MGITYLLVCPDRKWVLRLGKLAHPEDPALRGEYLFTGTATCRDRLLRAAAMETFLISTIGLTVKVLRDYECEELSSDDGWQVFDCLGSIPRNYPWDGESSTSPKA